MSRSAYTRLAAGLLFPLHERIKGHDTVRIRRSLDRSQWWSADHLEAYRMERLRGFLGRIGRHVPHYRRLFRETGFDPRALHSVSDLRVLPFLSKALVRAETDAFKSEVAGPLSRFNTGGSTGEPLIFYIGRERVSHDVAAKWRATRWWNVDIGDPEIVIWGSPIELGTQDRARNVRDRVFRTKLLPAFEMSPANVDRFIEAIRGARPRMLFGYPTAFAHVAARARERGIAMDDLGIRVTFVTAEKLQPQHKQVIEEVFSCRVANGYGGRDAGFIAHECQAGSMHITAEDVIVEVVDSDGMPVPEGVSGEIVVTHMATGEFPFVRYRTGDLGTLSPTRCACGRGLPLLGDVQGRATDFVVAQDGTVVHGLALIYILRDLPGIREFKVVQEDMNNITVFLVLEEPYPPDGDQRIREVFARRLGSKVNLSIERVVHIPRERSGKFCYISSAVDPHRTPRETGRA